MQNPLHNIVEVVTLKTDKDVNSRLAHGWILLETYTQTYDPQIFYKEQNCYFVLGRPSNVQPFIDERPRYGTTI